MHSNHNDDCRGFLTILDNVLTVGEVQAGQTHPRPGRLLEGAGGGGGGWGPKITQHWRPLRHSVAIEMV